jgi:uncharacterized membrane protein YadS
MPEMSAPLERTLQPALPVGNARVEIPAAAGPPLPSRWWTREDWLAVWLGGAVLLLLVIVGGLTLPSLRWGGAVPMTAPLAPGVVGPWLLVGAAALLLSGLGVAASGGRLAHYVPGFAVVFALAWLSMVLAANVTAAAWGLEYVVFALLLGLAVSHTTGTPDWLRGAARTEYFIKTGLVVMGATVLFAEVLQAGLLGLLQALGVVVVVWYAAFWLARRFRVDDELAVMLASAVSICGVSAAIAACGAIDGDRKKLSYVTSVVLVVALPMIVLLPWIVRLTGIPDVVAGAWMGGTLDTTGSVVAAGALVSETTVKIATIVKLSQNVLIGVAAFVISLWWTVRSSRERDAAATPGRVIWERFPKFVLGFVAASLLFSFALPADVVAGTKSSIGTVRTLWFALAFVSIGLETRLTDLLRFGEGRPLLAFLIAQAFNLVWTLLLAWLIFGGLIVPSPLG